MQYLVVVILCVIIAANGDVSHLKKDYGYLLQSLPSSLPSNKYLPPKEEDAFLNVNQPTDHHASSSSLHLMPSLSSQYLPPKQVTKASVEIPTFLPREYLPPNVHESSHSGGDTEEGRNTETQHPYTFGESVHLSHQIQTSKPKEATASILPPSIDYLPPVSNELHMNNAEVMENEISKNQDLSLAFDLRGAEPLNEYLPPTSVVVMQDEKSLSQTKFQPIPVATMQESNLAHDYLPPSISVNSVKIPIPSYASSLGSKIQYVTPVALTQRETQDHIPEDQHVDQTRQDDGYHYEAPLKYFHF